MRVLMFGWEFPPQITGGLGTACYGITKSLATQNVNVLFVVPKTFGNEDGRFATLQDAGEIPAKYLGANSKDFWRNVVYKEIPANITPYLSTENFTGKQKAHFSRSITGNSPANSDFTPFSGSYGENLWNEIDRYSFAASLVAKKETFDLIHAHDWLTFPAATAAKKISGKPLVVHVHATEFDRSGSNINRDIFDIEKQGMDLADKIISVSDYTRNILIDRYGIPPYKIVTIHNGVDKFTNPFIHESKSTEDRKIVTFLGRITYQKGPGYFIEAAYKVLQKQSNVEFVMAGSGDLKDKIVKQVESLGISAKVSFPGFLKNDDIKELFSHTDVYVMPSVSEPFGISPLEALQSEVPVILSRQSGVSEVIKYAIKVDYWNTDALSDAIYGVLNHKALSDFLAVKGNQEVNKMEWRNAGMEIVDLYKSIA